MKLTEEKLLQICRQEEFEQAEIKDYLHQLFVYGSVVTKYGEIKYCYKLKKFFINNNFGKNEDSLPRLKLSRPD